MSIVALDPSVAVVAGVPTLPAASAYSITNATGPLESVETTVKDASHETPLASQTAVMEWPATVAFTGRPRGSDAMKATVTVASGPAGESVAEIDTMSSVGLTVSQNVFWASKLAQIRPKCFRGVLFIPPPTLTGPFENF